jgi:hypothetical protein
MASLPALREWGKTAGEQVLSANNPGQAPSRAAGNLLPKPGKTAPTNGDCRAIDTCIDAY